MKYNAKSFEDIYRLSDFLNDNNIKPADIVGIYRLEYQKEFDLLYIESDNEKKMETYEFRYSDFFEWLKSRDGKQGERRKMTNEELFEKTFGRLATEIWALPEKYFLEWLKEDTPLKETMWKKTGGLFPDDRRLKCSECGYDADGLRDFEEANYCPGCGAKLQKRKKKTFEIHSADDFEKAIKTIIESDKG